MAFSQNLLGDYTIDDKIETKMRSPFATKLGEENGGLT
jgi:hypothetical protein